MPTGLKKDMDGYKIFRLSCLALLWLFLCVVLVRGRGVDFMVVFTIVTSGAIIFVPIYKKWKREEEAKTNSGKRKPKKK